MAPLAQLKDRRTSVDDVFDHLYDRITSLELRPGDKISEAEIASHFDISRQPVRDAFSRLENLDLLLIRPQRATVVKRFSTKEITKSRFVRACVEAEVLRRAAANCDSEGEAALEAALIKQKTCVEASDFDGFGRLDYEFHQGLCDIAKASFAFEVISFEKAKVDRLCTLAASKVDRIGQLFEDHRAIADRIIAHDAEGAIEYGMLHLSRLDETIEAISEMNPDYFSA